MTGPAGPGGDPEQWRAIRRDVSRGRRQLAAAASALYPGVPAVEGTPLLCRPQWIPPRPVPLGRVTLGWTSPPPAPAVTGAGPASAHLRPPSGDGGRYATYADAIAALDPPALFENRPAYRILGASAGPGGPRLELAPGRYFDTVSIGEALAHELAAARAAGGPVTMDRLPFRAAAGDPCDLARRPAGVAVSTLTLRRSGPGEARFLLHWRDPAKVTHAGGLYQVLPVGIFQPADDNPDSVRHDLDLWHGMVREYSEELLGNPEDYAALGSPVRYGQWDLYRRLTSARDHGGLAVWFLGLGVDPLTLVTDILTAAVFDAGLFDREFGRLPEANAEGRIIGQDGTAGFAFTAGAVERFAGGAEPMQAAGAAVLRLAWKHREALAG